MHLVLDAQWPVPLAPSFPFFSFLTNTRPADAWFFKGCVHHLPALRIFFFWSVFLLSAVTHASVSLTSGYLVLSVFGEEVVSPPWPPFFFFFFPSPRINGDLSAVGALPSPHKIPVPLVTALVECGDATFPPNSFSHTFLIRAPPAGPFSPSSFARLSFNRH